jgi:hypothetical protein
MKGSVLVHYIIAVILGIIVGTRLIAPVTVGFYLYGCNIFMFLFFLNQ